MCASFMSHITPRVSHSDWSAGLWHVYRQSGFHDRTVGIDDPIVGDSTALLRTSAFRVEQATPEMESEEISL